MTVQNNKRHQLHSITRLIGPFQRHDCSNSSLIKKDSIDISRKLKVWYHAPTYKYGRYLKLNGDISLPCEEMREIRFIEDRDQYAVCFLALFSNRHYGLFCRISNCGYLKLRIINLKSNISRVIYTKKLVKHTN
jgi:hypothetical protein